MLVLRGYYCRPQSSRAADDAKGTPKFGDRTTHQMDPANAREALREAERDVEEGADMLMVKPALAYLDVIRLLRDRFDSHPLAAYNVSGEYAMIIGGETVVPRSCRHRARLSLRCRLPSRP